MDTHKKEKDIEASKELQKGEEYFDLKEMIENCETLEQFKDGINTNTKCSNCAGTGLVTHTTSQDVITFPLPNETKATTLKKQNNTIEWDAPVLEWDVPLLEWDVPVLKWDVPEWD